MEHIDEETSDNGTVLEGALLCGLGLVPVGERNALTGVADHPCDAGIYHIAIFLVIGENGCPGKPIELGIVAAAIQRYTVCFAFFCIERDFSFIELLGEMIETEKSVPDGIVFQTPGVILIECKLGGLLIFCVNEKALCHIFCYFRIIGFSRELTVRTESGDRFE